LLRQHLLSNSRLFVQRAKEARSKIAVHALPFITPEATIVTYGPSRVVTTLLQRAAESGKYFNVIAITPSTPALQTQMKDQASALRNKHVPTSLIPAHATAYALSTLPKSDPALVICGASTVLENGGVTSTLGGYQVALLAKALQKPFYIATESYKFVQLYPLSQSDLPLQQEVVKFEGGEETGGDVKPKDGKKQLLEEEMVDYTPPELITALITENGVMTPNAVSEELIKLWF
jgi:translation initiation factor eIF-2B subunit alpha